ncbi:DUF6311 domain-containing protein [Halomonas sp. WWR20]
MPEMNLANKNRHLAWYASVCLAALLGAMQALWLYGAALDPRHVIWLLSEGDSFQHFIGWDMFRRDDWRWPLGINPTLGYAIDSSVVFSDSIPLIAIPLKLLHAWLPDPFQYVGLTMLLNLMLNGATSAGLAQRLGATPLVALLFATLLLGMSVATMRGPGALGHEALSAHWLIVLGLWLSLSSPSASTWRRWALLLSGAVLIHFYLFFMVGVLWSAWCLQVLWVGRHQPRYLWQVISRASLIVAGVLLLMWLAGYFRFGVDIEGNTGFGLYSAELLTFFNPGTAGLFFTDEAFSGASWFFSGWHSPVAGQYEGFAYAGIGVLMLWISALVVAIIRPGTVAPAKKRAALVLAVSLLFLFALGDRLVIGTWAFGLPYPDILAPITQYLRSSGRMAWPLLYAVTFLSLAVLLKRLPHAALGMLLGLCVIMQWWDSVSWFHYVRDNVRAVTNTDTSRPLAFPWVARKDVNRLAEGRASIRYLPGDDMHHLKAAAWLAARHGLAINVAYYARVNPGVLYQAASQERREAERGETSSDALYVLTSETLANVLCQQADMRCLSVEENVTLAVKRAGKTPALRSHSQQSTANN